MSDRKESTFEAVCLDQKMVTELSGDFILPDKYPDASAHARSPGTISLAEKSSTIRVRLTT